MAAHWLQAPGGLSTECKHQFLGRGRRDDSNRSHSLLTLKVRSNRFGCGVTEGSCLKLTLVVLILFPVAQLQPFRSGRTLHSSPSRHGCIWHHHFCSTIEASNNTERSKSKQMEKSLFILWKWWWQNILVWKCKLHNNNAETIHSRHYIMYAKSPGPMLIVHFISIVSLQVC